MTCANCKHTISVDCPAYVFGTKILCQTCYLTTTKNEKGPKPGFLEKLRAAIPFFR